MTNSEAVSLLMNNQYYERGFKQGYKQGVSDVLDRVRAEIDKIHEREGSSFDCLNALDELKEFIDKYRTESEE